jgi:hypothetical protein
MKRSLHPLVLLLMLTVAGAVIGHGRPAQARLLTWTLSGSVGYGHEIHPLHGPQATNVMLTGGLGFIRDYIRLELGVLGAYGALRTHDRERVNLEFRPMIRLTPPLVPLYGRMIFAGINPFDASRTVAYGWALGGYVPLGRLAPFAELGALPRAVQGQFHWVLEGRVGLGVRL